MPRSLLVLFRCAGCIAPTCPDRCPDLHTPKSHVLLFTTNPPSPPQCHHLEPPQRGLYAPPAATAANSTPISQPNGPSSGPRSMSAPSRTRFLPRRTATPCCGVLHDGKTGECYYGKRGKRRPCSAYIDGKPKQRQASGSPNTKTTCNAGIFQLAPA